MKNLIKGMVVLSILSLFGCTKVLYTHDEVLGRYKTRNDVQKTFGNATEKKVSDTSEVWLYQFDRGDLSKHTLDLYHNTPTATVNDFGKYDKYLMFSFDKAGNVARSDYSGVDMAVRRLDKGATIALIGAGVAVTVIAIVAVANGMKDMNFTGNIFSY